MENLLGGLIVQPDWDKVHTPGKPENSLVFWTSQPDTDTLRKGRMVLPNKRTLTV